MKKLKGTIIIITLLLLNLYAADEKIKTLEIGSPAPDFNLLGIDDNYYTLESFKNAEVLVIIFTANHCPTAQAYEDRIIKMTEEYKKRNVAVVAVSSNNPEAVRLDEMGYTDLGDSFADMKIRAKDKGFNFPYLFDGDKQETVRAYGAVATPHVFVFDRSRKLRFVGRIDDAENIKKVTVSDTRNAIDALLAGGKVPVEKTKVFGCSIKWTYKQEDAKKSIERWNAESVELESINLESVSKLMKNDSDNLRIINFWATWCGPCVSEFPYLIEINRMYRNRNFEMITLSVDAYEKQNEVLNFLNKNYASTKNYVYMGDDIYNLIETVDKEWQGAIPLTILVKPGGDIIYKRVGIIEPLELKKAIVGYVGRYYE